MCATGHRSTVAARTLTKLGFTEVYDATVEEHERLASARACQLENCRPRMLLVRIRGPMISGPEGAGPPGVTASRTQRLSAARRSSCRWR